ncbi:MAG: hypothetical protein WC473_00600 [Patescibacteria group bacterium]|jgi:hypothetical protein
MPLEAEENWGLWYDLMETPPEVPDLGHQKPPRRKRLKIRLPGGRRKVLKGKRGGENVPWYARYKDSWGSFPTRSERLDARHDLREAIRDAVEEEPSSLKQPRRELVFASYGGDGEGNAGCLMY